jgi:hypothetical protein
MTISGTRSRARSTAWACLSWCGAKRRRNPALTAVRRSSARAAALDQWRPCRTVDDAKQRPDWKLESQLEPRVQFLPAPCVHADLATPAALAASDEQRAASLVEIGLGKGKPFLDAQPRSPQDHDQRAQPAAVRVVTGGPHDGDVLLDLRPIGRTAQTLVVARRRPA